MFETVLGIPAHPLLVHFVVVFVPLLMIAALVYAFAPRTRRHIDWAVLGLTVIAPASALLAKLSGDMFVRRLLRRHEISAQVLAKIQVHRSYGTDTLYLSIVLAVVTAALLLVERAARRRSGEPSSNERLRWYLLVAATVLVVIVTGYYVFKTGDTGAHIVWQGF